MLKRKNDDDNQHGNGWICETAIVSESELHMHIAHWHGMSVSMWLFLRFFAPCLSPWWKLCCAREWTGDTLPLVLCRHSHWVQWIDCPIQMQLPFMVAHMLSKVLDTYMCCVWGLSSDFFLLQELQTANGRMKQNEREKTANRANITNVCYSRWYNIKFSAIVIAPTTPTLTSSLDMVAFCTPNNFQFQKRNCTTHKHTRTHTTKA